MSDTPPLPVDKVGLVLSDPQAAQSEVARSFASLRDVLRTLANAPEEAWADPIMVALLKSRGAVSSDTQIPGDEVDAVLNEFRKFLAQAGVYALLLSGDVALFVDPADGKVEVRMTARGKALAAKEPSDEPKPATE